MNKTLLLYSSEDAYFFSYIKSDSIILKSVYHHKNWMKNKILSAFRKFHCKITKLFYGEWYRKLDSFDKIIVFDMPYNYDKKLLENIARRAKHSQLYFYSWNMIKNEDQLKEMKKETERCGFKFYSYNLADCQKYSLNFNTIMYEKNIDLECVDIQYDALFLGYMKDREEKIKALYNLLVSIGLTPYFLVVKKDKKEKELGFCHYLNHELEYSEYIKKISASRIILDINQEGQDGLSLRLMESIYLRKKLITTNVAVLNSKAYNKNNIFVLKIPIVSVQEIIEFINQPFVEYSQEVKEYYSLEKWVERFR